MTEGVGDLSSFDETDVPQALNRITDDGPGDRPPGESDFVGFATGDVETEPQP